MRLNRHVTRYAMMLLAAAMLSAAAATDALARGGAGFGHIGGMHGAHMRGGFQQPAAGSGPINAEADFQSIGAVHGAAIAGNAGLAGKSGISIREWLKLSTFAT